MNRLALADGRRDHAPRGQTDRPTHGSRTDVVPFHRWTCWWLERCPSGASELKPLKLALGFAIGSPSLSRVYQTRLAAQRPSSPRLHLSPAHALSFQQMGWGRLQKHGLELQLPSSEISSEKDPTKCSRSSPRGVQSVPSNTARLSAVLQTLKLRRVWEWWVGFCKAE